MVSKSAIRRVPELRDMEVLSAQLVNHSFPLHFHETYVLEWVTEGSDRCVASQSVAHRGQLFVHGPGVPHDGSTGNDSLEYQACYPTPELVAELLGTEVDQLPAVGTRVLESRPVRRAAERLFTGLAEQASSTLARDLAEVLRRAHDGAAACPPSSAGDRSRAGEQPTSGPPALPPVLQGALPGGVERARNHLIAHRRHNVTTDELAQVAGLSRFHLIREFRRSLGITPRQFLISLRVSEARALINGGVPIAEAAFATGFADQSHLTRQFKRVTAFSPGQLRSTAG